MAITRLGGANAITGTIPTSVAPGQGKILQVVQSVHSTQVNQGSTSYSATGLSGSITPSSSSNKILISVEQYFTFRVTTSSERQAAFKLLRGSTDLDEYLYALVGNNAVSSDFRIPCISTYSYLDSPNTSGSAVTYSTQFKLNGTSADLYAQNDGSPSTITLMEISG
jgi:hypothetical protein